VLLDLLLEAEFQLEEWRNGERERGTDDALAGEVAQQASDGLAGAAGKLHEEGHCLHCVASLYGSAVIGGCDRRRDAGRLTRRYRLQGKER